MPVLAAVPGTGCEGRTGTALVLAVTDRVLATTTSMRSTEKGSNCLSGRRMNSCLSR